jgi:hypothetical protein
VVIEILYYMLSTTLTSIIIINNKEFMVNPLNFISHEFPITSLDSKDGSTILYHIRSLFIFAFKRFNCIRRYFWKMQIVFYPCILFN